MRKSNILLGALAIATGLLIGFGTPKEVKADTGLIDMIAGPTGVIKASHIKASGVYYDGDCKVTIHPNSNGSPVTLNLDTDVNMKQLMVKENGTDNRADLIITGEKKLTVNSVGASNPDNLIAISFKSLTIESGVISAISKTSAMMTTDFSGNGYITINGGTVTAKGDNEGIFATGKVTINNNATVTATGSQTAIFSAGDITINGSTVTATGTGQNGYGIHSSGNMTITNSTVTAIGGSGSDGIFVYHKNLTISGSSTVVKSSGGSAAIIAEEGKITISDPLKVVKPSGGGVSANGQYISNTAGSEEPVDIAKEVEIKKNPLMHIQ